MAEKKSGPDSNIFLSFVTDAESEKALASVPFADFGLKSIVVRGGLEEAQNYLKTNKSPAILLVDVSKSELPISDVARLAEVCEPGVEVIALGQKNDVGVFRGLVNLGVRDYVVKPLTEGLIVRNINTIRSGTTAHKNVNFMSAGNIVTVLGARGGVGASTVAANCGWLLADKIHKKVYLMDMNLHSGVLCYFFDLSPTQGLLDLLGDTEHLDASVIDKAFISQSDRLHVATAQLPLQEHFTPQVNAFKMSCDLLCRQSHYTIIDFPRNYDLELLKHTLGESHIIVIVCDLTFFSVRDTVRYIELARSVASTQQRIILVANRVGEFKKGEFSVKNFEDVVHHKIDYTLPFDDTASLEALNKGVPAAAGTGMFAKAIQDFAQGISGREAAPVKKGLFW